MKNIITTILFVVVVFTIAEYVKNNKGEINKNVKRIENQVVTEIPVIYEEVRTESVDYQSVRKNNQHINIVPLGNIDYSILEETSNVIKDFYGYSTSIGNPEQVTSDLFINGDTLDAYKCVTSLRKDVKTIYITNNNLYTKDGMRLRGYTTIYGNTIIMRGKPEFIKETTIHEIGHTLGLDHCSDLTCIMAIANDEYDSGDFCSKCKNIINNN
jgi:predicted Zn-dependent protease